MGHLVKGETETFLFLGNVSEYPSDRRWFRGIAINKIFQNGEILAASQSFAYGGLAVPSGPADFLGVIFQTLGKVIVIDIPYIGLVNPHAKCNGCHNNCLSGGHEPVLNFVPLFIFQSGMIGPGRITGITEGSGHTLGGGLQGDIDNSWGFRAGGKAV